MSAQWVAPINLWVDQWAAGIWRACWQGSAAILLAWALCRALPRMSPRVRCWLWRMAYAKLLVSLLWTSPVDMPLLRPARTPEPFAASIQAPAAGPAAQPAPRRPTGTGASAIAVVAETALTPLSALSVLWLLGAMMVGAGFVSEWRAAHRRGGIAPLDLGGHGELAADFERLCRCFGIRHPIALLVTVTGDRPHIFGVIRPAIVLPAELVAGSDRTALRAVLAHEIAHVRRRDLVWNWLPAVAHTLFFFCPLVWLANREWQAAQEIACDELAIVNTGTDVADYGETLVRMVTPYGRLRRPGIAALGIIETQQTLKRRLIAMRFIQPVTRRKRVLAGAACAALGVFGIVPWRVVAQGAKSNRILFVSNRMEPKRFSIFAMDADGSHVTRLTRGPVPEFEAVESSDKKLKVRPVPSHGNVMELNPVGSPDGRRIAFTLAVPERPEPGSRVKMNLYTMNTDGSGCKQLTFFTHGLQATSPAWSPDGKYIAFTLQSPNSGAPGGIDTTVLVTDFDGFWPIAEGMWPSWSTDGKTVLYTAFADRKGVATDLCEKGMAGLPEGKKILLEGVMQAVLSPDGKHLAYISNRAELNGEKTGNLFVSNADGSEPKQLTRLTEMGPIGLQWSSDGRRIYFTRPASPDPTRAINYRIYAVDAGGGPMQELTKGDAPDYLGAAPGPFLATRWMDRIATTK